MAPVRNSPAQPIASITRSGVGIGRGLSMPIRLIVNAVSAMSSMSSVSVFARSSVPAPAVATGFDGAAALTAMLSEYSSAAKLFVNRFNAAFTVP